MEPDLADPWLNLYPLPLKADIRLPPHALNDN